VHRNAYTPNEEHAVAYDKLYAEYVQLHDYFGRGANEVMKRLRALKREAVSAGATAGSGADATGSVPLPGPGAGVDDAAAAEVPA
jgi:L-ribulokinase